MTKRRAAVIVEVFAILALAVAVALAHHSPNGCAPTSTTRCYR